MSIVTYKSHTERIKSSNIMSIVTYKSHTERIKSSNIMSIVTYKSHTEQRKSSNIMSNNFERQRPKNDSPQYWYKLTLWFRGKFKQKLYRTKWWPLAVVSWMFNNKRRTSGLGWMNLFFFIFFILLHVNKFIFSAKTKHFINKHKIHKKIKNIM
jgi:hypothetical protein